jgi:integrase
LHQVSEPQLVLLRAGRLAARSDVARLSWPNIILEARELRFRTEKTGAQMVVPLAEPFYNYLLGIAGDDPQGPLFPRALRFCQRQNLSGLSHRFHSLLTQAGIVQKRIARPKGAAPKTRRVLKDLGFHCLRHTATTLLKRAGASDVVAREIIGHKSANVSRIYTHIDVATLRAAIDKMPDLTINPPV